jgi:hypothetical protein
MRILKMDSPLERERNETLRDGDEDSCSRFPNSVWERTSPKLCFGSGSGGTHFRLAGETEFRESAFPNRVWERDNYLSSRLCLTLIPGSATIHALMNRLMPKGGMRTNKESR